MFLMEMSSTKQELEKAAAGVTMAVVGLFLEPATPRGRDVSSSAITKTPDPDRTWGGQRDASLLSGGFSLAPWIGWPGPSPPSAPLLPALASPLRCELHDSGALRWCSAQGTTLDLVPLHPPSRRGQRLEKWCLSASLTKQALCKQTTVYSGLPGRGAPLITFTAGSCSSRDTGEWPAGSRCEST